MQMKPECQQIPDKISKFSQPNADVKCSDSASETSVHDIKSQSNDSMATAGKSEQQHSDGGTVGGTVLDSNEMVSQKETLKKVGLVQRFRMMYKQYGVVLVCVHAVTSSVWVSLFYWATVRYG